METLKKFSGLLAVVAVVIAIFAFAKAGAISFGSSTDDFFNANGGFKVDNTTVIDGSGNLAVGTSLAGIRTGSCTIWDDSTTIAASTTGQVECQSATNGTLASGLTGVTADSICSVRMASSTNTTSNGLLVGGTSASSTAGSIVVQLSNLTGTTFTWNATASSSAKWNYICLDPA